MRAITFHTSIVRWPICKALGLILPSVRWGRLSTLRLREIPEQPLPGDDWVRIRPRLGGICGTDLTVVMLGAPPDYFGRGMIIDPMVLGHENVGVVIERGPDARDVPEGLRVNVDPNIGCAPRGLEPCPSCREGQFAACWNVAEGAAGLGFSIGYSAKVGGSWSESFVAHKSQLVSVPEGLSDEQAVLVDPLSSGVHAVLRRPPGPEDQDILVMGCGLVGLGVIAFLRAWGFRGRILATARHRFQQALALHMGASEVWDAQDLAAKDIYARIGEMYHLRPLRGLFGKPVFLGGVDVIYDSIGNCNSVEDALRLVRPQGTVMVVGMGHPRWVDWDPLTHKQITIMGSHGRGTEVWKGGRCHTYMIVQQLLAEGKFPAEKLLTHTFPLEDYRTALDVLTHKGRHAAVHGAFRISK